MMMQWWSTDGRAQLEYDPDTGTVQYWLFAVPNAQDLPVAPEGGMTVHLDTGAILLHGFSAEDCKTFFGAIRYARPLLAARNLERPIP